MNTIAFNFDINAAPEMVFKAITTKKGYQGWWAVVCDVDCQLNGESSIRFEKENITEEMCFRTVEVEKNRRLLWQCVKNNVFPSWIGTSLLFEISQKGNGSLFKFTQTSPDKNWSKHPDYNSSKAGWEFFMNSLKNYCETGKGKPWG